MFYDDQFIWKLATPRQTNATIFQLFPAIKESSIEQRLLSSQKRTSGIPTRTHIEYIHTYSWCYWNARYSIKANRTSMGISRASKIITPWTGEVEWGMKQGGGKRSRSQCLRTWTNLHNDRELPAMKSLFSCPSVVSSLVWWETQHQPDWTTRLGQMTDSLWPAAVATASKHSSYFSSSSRQDDGTERERERKMERETQWEKTAENRGKKGAKFESKPKTKGARPWQWLRLWLWPRVPKADHSLSPSSPAPWVNAR